MDHPLYLQACQLIDCSGLGSKASQLKNFLKPTIRTESSPASALPFPLGTSKLGGLPDLPPTLVWPSWREVPMAFLAQIQLCELAPNDVEQVLPTRGFLYFFCQSQDLFQGYDTKVWDYIDPQKPESWKVLFFDGERTQLQATKVPDGLAKFALLPDCALHFSAALTLPPLDSFRIASLNLEEKERRLYLNLLGIFDTAFWGMGGEVYYHHRLLGYPVQMQDDMQLLCELCSLHVAPDWARLDEETKAPIKIDALQWVHLLQINTDEHAQVTWGEAGSLSYWIKQADLRRRNFEGCWAIEDSL